MKTILITGINGFLGSHLAKTLKFQYEIIGLEYSINNLHRIADEDFLVYSSEEIVNVFKENKIFGIIHAATLYKREKTPLKKVLNTNIVLPINLYELAVKNDVVAIAQAAMAGAAVTNAEVKAVTDAAQAANNGRLFPAEKSAAGEFITAADSKNFVIQLESGLLKNSGHKCLPDGLTELELVLRLAPNTQALASAGAATYQIDNPTLYCPVMQILNGDVMASYKSVVAQEGLMWSGISCKSYVNAVPLAAGTKTLQINDRSISCLGMVTALRVATADSTNAIYSNGSFGFTDVDSTNKITEFHYILNGQNFPASNIRLSVAENGLDIGRATEESLKALAKHGEDYSKSTICKNQCVKQFDAVYAASPATNGLDVPRGLFSVDLKKMSDDGLRMVGYNSAQNSSPSVLELDCTVALAAACTATTFAIVESFYQMSPNGDLSSAM